MPTVEVFPPNPASATYRLPSDPKAKPLGPSSPEAYNVALAGSCASVGTPNAPLARTAAHKNDDVNVTRFIASLLGVTANRKAMPGQLSGLGFSNHNVVRGPAKGCQHAVTRASALRGI